MSAELVSAVVYTWSKTFGTPRLGLESWASIRAGYGHFFVGEYIKQSKAGLGGATDADWVYVQTTLSF